MKMIKFKVKKEDEKFLKVLFIVLLAISIIFVLLLFGAIYLTTFFGG